jgi:RNase P subunit RPR2
MARRQTKNITKIARIDGIQANDAYLGYICINCHQLNTVNIGQTLLSPEDAYKCSVLKCMSCGFIHSQNSNLPFSSWPEEYIQSESLQAKRFWQAFFRIYTENKEAYWKKCNSCGLVLPFNAFSKHSGWGPLERQMECRGCKGAINAVLNPARTKEQLYESSIRRRIADLFVNEAELKYGDEFIRDLFKRFNSQCFKTKKPLDINNRASWAIDHILPSKYLYPLTSQNAALLSAEANSNKRDMWPSQFYNNHELIDLARITGADLELLSRKEPVENRNIDINGGVKKYLDVRENSNLNKRIKEIIKVLKDYELIDRLSPENRKLLGLSKD